MLDVKRQHFIPESDCIFSGFSSNNVHHWFQRNVAYFFYVVTSYFFAYFPLTLASMLASKYVQVEYAFEKYILCSVWHTLIWTHTPTLSCSVHASMHFEKHPPAHSYIQTEDTHTGHTQAQELQAQHYCSLINRRRTLSLTLWTPTTNIYWRLVILGLSE